MIKGRRRAIVTGLALTVIALYLIAPYFILISVIKNAKSAVSGPEAALRSFYYFAYPPLLSALPKDFWYKRIMIKRANALCDEYPGNCIKPES